MLRIFNFVSGVLKTVLIGVNFTNCVQSEKYTGRTCVNKNLKIKCYTKTVYMRQAVDGANLIILFSDNMICVNIYPVLTVFFIYWPFGFNIFLFDFGMIYILLLNEKAVLVATKGPLGKGIWRLIKWMVLI